MPKYVPRLEGIMHDPKGSTLCLLTVGHISAYNMDKYVPRLEDIMHDPKGSTLCLLTMGHITWTTQYYCFITLNVFGDLKKK
jgi:hypothetical protein